MRRVFRLDPVIAALVALTAIGLALRFWGIQHGLPHPSSRPDEREVLDHTAGFAAGDWNPRWFIYPPFYFHLTWLWDEGVLSIWRLWRPRPDYFDLLKTNLAPLLLGGRLLTAALGTATIPVAYWIGRRMRGYDLGLVAAALVAGCYLLVRDSHALKPDAPLGLGVLASTWLLARYAERPTMRRAIGAGLAIGLTTALKYNGILLLVPAYLADLMAPGERRWRLMPRASACSLVVAAVATIVLTSPHLVLDAARTWDTYLVAKWNVYVTRPEALPSADAGPFARAWLFVRTRAFGYHLAFSLRHGCGLAIAVLTPLGLVAALRRGAHPMLPLSAAFIVLYYLVAGASPVHLARYFTPIVPLVLVLVADLVVRIATAMPARWRTGGAVLLTAALLVEPVRSAVGFDRVAAQTDTRVLASEWLAALPRGAVVAVVGSGPFALSEPVLPPNVRRATLRVEPSGLAHAGITHVITVWHSDLAFFAHGAPEDLGPLDDQLRLVAEFSPFLAGPAGVFENEDAFYIPFYDFAGVVRPGPLVRIYATGPT